MARELVLLAGGVVFDGHRLREADVLVEAGVVAALAPGLEAGPGVRTIACKGRVVAPAFVDLHVHLRFPGNGELDTPEEIAQAALRGGVTLMVAMANTDPPVDSVARLEEARARVGRLAVEVSQAATMTRARRGEEPAPLAELAAAGVEVCSDDGSGVASSAVMRAVMRQAEEGWVVLAQHAEDPSLSAGGVLNEGRVAAELGLGGIPEVGEAVMVARDLELAKVVPVPLHFCHVSARESLNLIRGARREGMRVSCEVTPHHLLLDETALASGDPRFKVNPPLRSRATQMALRQAVLRGEVDAIASDHAPHPPSRKDRPLAEAAFGMVGVAELWPASWTALRHAPGAPARAGLPGWLTPEEWGALERLLSALTTGPAAVLGRDRVLAVGQQAEVVVLDPNRPPSFEPGSLYRSGNCPYLGLALEGRVEVVLHRGVVHAWD